MEKTTILLADDHQLIMDGVSQIISVEENFVLLDTKTDGDQALSYILNHQPDIAILDIEMPGKSGIEVLESINGKSHTKVIILSAYEDVSLIQKCLAEGAKGYLLKRSNPEEIISSIKRVSEGGTYVSVETSELLVESSLQSKKPTEKSTIGNDKLSQLTNRELEILKLIVDGLSNSEIADQLYISKRTVDTHRVNLMQKLDIHNTVELVKFALANNL